MVKYGFLHCHTQNSVKDSVMTVERLCERAKEMGAPAVALTDHGVLTGIPSFIKAAAKYEVKPIVGCEYYVKENPYDSRLHLIVYAKFNNFSAKSFCDFYILSVRIYDNNIIFCIEQIGNNFSFSKI